jgi:hypothetical protein
MRAFEVYLNDNKLCLAGIGDDGVLTAIVNWVTGHGRAESFLEVGGLDSSKNEHVKWINHKPLRAGDEILIRAVETTLADKPRKRHRIDPAERLRSQKSYVRTMAKQLGWKIQARPKRSAS